MSEEFVSDATLTEKLKGIFGIANVVSPDHSRGYHEVYFADKGAASEVLKILDAQGFLNSMQSSGGWIAENRPNIGIICGNESQRAKDTELNKAALHILDILDKHRTAIQTAARIGDVKQRM